MLQLHTLGELRLNGPAGELLPGRRKELALLAFLARRSPRAVRRSELMALLWGERDEERARHSLRQALLVLRRTLGDGLASTPESTTLREGGLEMDLVAFEADVAAGRLREAVERWEGDFLAGAEDVGGEPYRLWVEAERERARRQLSRACEQLVLEAHKAGDRPGAVAWAERWAELAPFDEAAHLRLVEELGRDDLPEAARVRHLEFAARLRRELGLEPSEAFTRLGLRLQEAGPPPSAPGGGAGSAALFTPDPVGQEGPRAELCAAWRAVEGEAAVAVVVEGGEGMGKTLLCEDFLRTLEDGPEPALILQARPRGERNLPWSAARELLAPLLGAPGLGGAPDRALAELARLLPAVRDRWPRLPEPRGDERALHHAVAQVLEVVAQELPVALFLDDFPACDPETRGLLVALARHLPPGVLLLLCARNDAAEGPARALAELRHLRGIRRLKLTPLPAEGIEALLASMLELPAPERRGLAERLHAETGGNPFFAAEIVAAMVDEGGLAVDGRGVWRLRGPSDVGSLPLPASVREATGRRLARTSGAASRVAAAAAVLGGPVDAALLRQVAGIPSAAFDDAVEELVARHLLRHAPARAGEWELAHPLVRRVAYDALPAGEREALHRAAAAAHGVRAEGDTAARDALAYHRARAGVPPRRGILHTRPGLAAAVAAGCLLLLVGVQTVAPLVGGRDAGNTPILAVGVLHEHGGAAPTGAAAAAGDMLATNLARVPGLKVVSSARMYEILGQLGNGPEQQRASLADAARRAGADELLEGAVHRTPQGGLRLDLRRVELRTGSVRGAYTISGADLFELVDRATAELAGALGLPTEGLRLAEVATTSLVAYRFYEEGLRSHATGDYRSAARLFEAALSEDSLFAMAAHFLWTSREALHQMIPDTALERILRLAQRAPDRERLLMRVKWAVALDLPQRVAIAETLAVRYPTEPDGHLLLGGLRVNVGDFLGALPHLERVASMDSLGLRGTRPGCRACEALSYIIQAYSHADSLAAAERVARYWVRRQPRSASAWAGLAVTLVAQGRHAEALAARRAAAALHPVDHYDALFPAMVRIRAGDFAGADRLLGDLARDGTPEVRHEALWFLTISLRYQGRLREALAVIRRARDAAGGAAATGTLQQEGQVLFELGRFREAAQRFDSVARLTLPPQARTVDARRKSWNLTHRAGALAAAGDTGSLAALAYTIEAWGRQSLYGRDWRLHHHVRGLLLAARGEPAPAAAAFRRAIYSPTMGYTRTNYELARVLLDLGRPREAVAVLQPAFRGPLEASNLYVTHTELHALLGRAWEALGRPDSAAHHYRRVVHAWQSADPELRPRRDSIRARLAVLQREVQ